MFGGNSVINLGRAKKESNSCRRRCCRKSKAQNTAAAFDAANIDDGFVALRQQINPTFQYIIFDLKSELRRLFLCCMFVCVDAHAHVCVCVFVCSVVVRVTG